MARTGDKLILCVRFVTSPTKSYDNISMLYRLAFLFNTIGPHGFACLFSICSASTPLKKCKFRIEKNWARRPIGPLGKNCTEISIQFTSIQFNVSPDFPIAGRPESIQFNSPQSNSTCLPIFQ